MSTYPHVKFLTSAAEAHQLAPDTGREIAFAGRSNSGKSTAINAITQRSGSGASQPHARTHPTDQFLRARRTTAGWSICRGTDSPKCRKECALAGSRSWSIISTCANRWWDWCLIVDSRRGLGAQDAAMLEWVLARDRQAHMLLTKADKLNRRDALRVLKEIKEACSDTAVTAQLFSAHAKQGLEEARGYGPLVGLRA